jgi:hypothetical protein
LFRVRVGRSFKRGLPLLNRLENRFDIL